MMENESRIAVLEANYANIQRRAEEHEDRDEDRFDKTFAYIKGRSDEIVKHLEKMDGKIETLTADFNQRKGAFKMSGAISHGITVIVSVGTALGIIKAIK